MLYPALVMKLISFKNNEGQRSTFPAEGFNKIEVQLDNGDIVNIDIFSNDKEMNSLFQYLDNKALQGVKNNKVKALALDLAFNPDNKYTPQLDIIEQRLISEGLTAAKAKQASALELVPQILKEKSTLQSTSIFRIALAAGYKGFNSRSIYVKTTEAGDKVYSTSGFYNHAQLENHIPIELSYIYNAEQQPVGYVKVKTSNLINANQISVLLSHAGRTIKESLDRNKKPFIPFFVVSSIGSLFSTLALEFNAIQVENRKSEAFLDIAKYERAKELLIAIESELRANPIAYKEVQIELPLLLTNEKLVSGLNTVGEHGKSPFQLFRNALINLNFSKENPQTKNMLKEQILNSFFSPIMQAQYNPRMLTVYNIPAPNLLGEGESWGYMVDNVDFSKLTLGKEDVDRIFNYCEEIVKGL